MFKILRSKKTIVGLVAAAAVVAGAGGAYAYWSTTGSGTGTASSNASAQSVTAVQTTTISTIAPGVAAQTLSGNFNNPNPGPVYITAVTASIASVFKGGTTAVGCDATDFVLATPTMSVGHEVAAGTGVDNWTGAKISFNDKGTNQDACKGTVVNLAYTVS